MLLDWLLDRCVANPDQSVTIFVGSNDHHVYRLEATAQKTLRGTMCVIDVLILIAYAQYNLQFCPAGGIDKTSGL